MVVVFSKLLSFFSQGNTVRPVNYIFFRHAGMRCEVISLSLPSCLLEQAAFVIWGPVVTFSPFHR